MESRPQSTESAGPRSPEPDSARTTPNHMSLESYPSWLPKRPAPPGPQSTIHSTVAPQFAGPGSGSSPTTPTEQQLLQQQLLLSQEQQGHLQQGDVDDHGRAEPLFVGGRKPTPRSVRVVSLPDDRSRREPTDQTKVDFHHPMASPHHRAWSRATGTPVSNYALNASLARPIKPKFRTKGLNLDLLRDPSWAYRAYFFVWPVLVFAHIPVQTFFDFNAVFILFQVSKFPDPVAPNVPGSGRNWSLGAAAYIACWAVWIFVVFLIYEVVYSFARRWRLKRPLIMPIYLSAPSFSLASLGSYSRFCFIQHIRWSAFSLSPSPSAHSSSSPYSSSQPTSSMRVFLAESAYFYSQNTRTVFLLLPRAALCLALLLSFSSPNPLVVASARTAAGGVGIGRDQTFFRGMDGTLTDYARGVLIANAAWTGWRVLVLMISWLGVWLFSGYSCGGLCGPRYRWEEDDANEKRAYSVYASPDADSDIGLQWDWKEDTRQRIQDAFEFCMAVRSLRSGPGGVRGMGAGGGGKEKMMRARYSVHPRDLQRHEEGDEGEEEEGSAGFEGIERVMAAVGLAPTSSPNAPMTPSRRGVLSEDFYTRDYDLSRSLDVGSGPGTGLTPEQIAAKVAMETEEEEKEALKTRIVGSPYPFTTSSAQISSSEERVPFPPSPRHSANPSRDGDARSKSLGGSGRSRRGPLSSGEELEEGEGDEGEEMHGDGYDEGEYTEAMSPSSGRASGSMSSLGQPIQGRYPFGFRRPGRGSSSASANTRLSPNSSHFGHAHTPSRSTNTTSASGTGSNSQGYTHSHSNSYSAASRSANTPSTNSRSTRARHAYRESTDSNSPMSRYTSDSSSPASNGVRIPQPPRHPGRARAGTVPVAGSASPNSNASAGPVPASPSPAVHRGGGISSLGARARMRAESDNTEAYGAFNMEDYSDMYDTSGEADVSMSQQGHSIAGAGGSGAADDSIAEEREDILGLLSSTPSPPRSPRSSMSAVLRQRASASFSRVRHAHGMGGRQHTESNNSSHSASSSSRSRAHSLISPPRSRAQSLIQTLSNISHSSLELPRALGGGSGSGSGSASGSSLAGGGRGTRQQSVSMTRLEDSYLSSGHSRSGSGSASEMLEGHTFGQGATRGMQLGSIYATAHHGHLHHSHHSHLHQQHQDSAVQRVSEESEPQDEGENTQLLPGEGGSPDSSFGSPSSGDSDNSPPRHASSGSSAGQLRAVTSSSTMGSALAPSEHGSQSTTAEVTPTGPNFTPGAQTLPIPSSVARGELETIHEPVARSSPVEIPRSPTAGAGEDKQHVYDSAYLQPSTFRTTSTDASAHAPGGSSGATDSRSSESRKALSSAPESFITLPATIEGQTTDSSGRTPMGSWEERGAGFAAGGLGVRGQVGHGHLHESSFGPA